MQIYGKIDIGKMRKTNQDAFLTKELDDGSAFVVVCDGMGGANAGNVASEGAVRVIADYVIKSYQSAMGTDSLVSMLKSAVASANMEIYDLSLKNTTLNGMGTTVVAAIIRETVAVVCHIGDSRAYLVTDELSQITTDHSVVQSLIECGKLTADEARVHPRKNVITRALGVEEDVMSDCSVIEIKPGNSILICTDGLSNFVEADDILETFKNSKPQDVVEILVDKANEGGGGDNITAVTVTV